MRAHDLKFTSPSNRSHRALPAISIDVDQVTTRTIKRQSVHFENSNDVSEFSIHEEVSVYVMPSI